MIHKSWARGRQRRADERLRQHLDDTAEQRSILAKREDELRELRQSQELVEKEAADLGEELQRRVAELAACQEAVRSREVDIKRLQDRLAALSA